MSPPKRVYTETEQIKVKKNSLNGVDLNNNDCFTLFNPKTKGGLDFLTTNWSKAIVTLLKEVYGKKEQMSHYRKKVLR